MFNQILDAAEPSYAPEMVKFNMLEKPQPVYFYRRHNGTLITMGETEAATFGKFHRFLGKSDGTAYYNYLKNCGVRLGQTIPMAKAQEIMQAAWKAEFEAMKKKQDRTLPKQQNVHWPFPTPDYVKQSFQPPA